jgi:hypothetical protein
MTASSTIESAWNSAIWQHATVQAITSKIITRPYSTLSEKEFQSLYLDKRINFIEALTTRSQRYNETANVLGRVTQYEFRILINYYKDYESDTSGAAYGAIRNFFETLFDLVVSELGNTWDSTVDFWKPQEDQLEITDLEIDKKRTWKGSFSYTATVTTSS